MKSRNAAGAAGWIWILGFLIPFALYSPIRAQNVEGQIIAAEYGAYKVPGSTIGSFLFPPAVCQVSGGGQNFSAFATGTAVKIIDSNPALTEIATPSSVFINQCSINMTTTYQHVPPYYLTSGTGGLQEAINANGTGTGANTIILNAAWYQQIVPRSAATVIASVIGNTILGLVDVTTVPYTTYAWNGSAYAVVSAGGGIPQKVIYASKISGVTAGVAVIPTSSASGTVDSAAAINAAISGGNVELEVDSGFALSTSLVLSSNTTIHCTAPQYGFIMQAASNASVIVNAHQNSPTTASGTGGYLPSNIADQGIAIRGCTLNANSTQAVTGTNSQGTAHGATPGGKFTYGVFLMGVNGVNLDSNNVYDSGCFATFFSNVTNLFVNNNYIQQPTPTITKKFTDAMHIIGPAQFVYMTNNHLTSGDDAIALNADDGNRTGSGDPNSSYVQSAVKWGPILDVHVDNTTLDYTDYGLRLYSATELIDRVFVTNTEGTNCGNNGLIAALSALGQGNIGKVRISGWTDQTDGTCNVFAVPYNFWLSANFQNVEISGVNISNPGVNWPVLTQTAGQGETLSLHDWNLNTTSSTFSNIIALNGGTLNQLQISGLNWNDYIGTGSVFSGTSVPTNVSCSGYYGPNRLLAAGFAPAIQNGDCFTNTYPTVYVNSAFTEATSGALAGTTPATCTNGCTGTWTAAAGGPSSGFWTYGTGQVSLSGVCTAGGSDNFCPVYINAGVANFTMRVNVAQFDTGAPPGLAFVVRWTNNQNFVTFLSNGAGTWGLYDVVANVTTQIGASVNLGTLPGLYTVVMNGTSATLIAPNGSKLTGTISGSNTATNVGLSSNLTTVQGTDIVNYFSVKSK